MLLEPNLSQLILIDFQAKLMPVIDQGPAVLNQAHKLASVAKLWSIPIWGTEQNPSKLGNNHSSITEFCDKTLEKMQFSACNDELLSLLLPPSPEPKGNARSLPKHLRKAEQPEPQRSSLILAGCEAHVCLLQTALDLLEQDFEVWVVTDACGSRRQADKDAAFDRLAANGAELITVEMLAFEFLRSCEDPRFRDVLALIK